MENKSLLTQLIYTWRGENYVTVTAVQKLFPLMFYTQNPRDMTPSTSFFYQLRSGLPYESQLCYSNSSTNTQEMTISCILN